MSGVKLNGYCGLYCGACDVFRLSEKARQEGAKAKWEEMPERLKKVIRRADITCQGCRSDVLFAGCRKCPILKCARRKGVESCALCAKYPCFYFWIIDLFVKWRKLAAKLPHTSARRPNLEFIRKGGLARFLVEQEQRWRCPQCGAPLSWYLERCASCGRYSEPSFPGGNPTT
jgi:hypothetical protein